MEKRTTEQPDNRIKLQGIDFQGGLDDNSSAKFAQETNIGYVNLLQKPLPKHNPSMSMPNQEEFDAKLQAIEARMDARVARIEGKIDTFLARTNERDRVLEERDKRLTLIAENAESSARRAEGMYKSLWAGIFAIFIAVLTIGVGSFYSIQQSNQGLVQTIISAFQLGQNTSHKPSK